jgi:minor histocompatibility antigen H13
VPGLLACLALRYDASRSTDMRARARAAAEAITSALDGLAPGSSSQAAANAASSAAERAYDDFADREARQRLDSLDGTNSAGGGGGGGGEDARVPVSDAVLHQRAYFTPVMLAYIGGLSLAFTANAVTGLGQPALLYLVPCTLGAVLATAASRGELGRVWAYTDVASFGAGIGGKEEAGKEAK